MSIIIFISTIIMIKFKYEDVHAMDKIKQLQKMIEESNNIVVFSGAGVSTESGLKDFRSKDGLYNQKNELPAEYLLSSDCFYNNPDLFYNYYKNNLNSLSVKPNITHIFLKRLEDSGKLKAIITQNIDGLHSRAGNKKVFEIHGSTYKNHCINCNKEYSAEFVFNSKGKPMCTCGGLIKPDVVLYGEALPENEFNDAIKSIQNADMMIVIGTSLTVSPANSMVSFFKGKNLVIINNDATPYDYVANLVIHQKLSTVFTPLMENMNFESK